MDIKSIDLKQLDNHLFLQKKKNGFIHISKELQFGVHNHSELLACLLAQGEAHYSTEREGESRSCSKQRVHCRD